MTMDTANQIWYKQKSFDSLHVMCFFMMRVKKWIGLDEQEKKFPEKEKNWLPIYPWTKNKKTIVRADNKM